MSGDRIQMVIGSSLIAIGLLQATLGLYADDLVLVGIGIALAVLNVAYVYVVVSRSD